VRTALRWLGWPGRIRTDGTTVAAKLLISG
jgi:hypothetical protein